jgi:small subunit ribosomal protein S9
MTAAKTEKYIEGIGRRKEAVARVRITPASKTSFVINDKTISDYFKTESLQRIVTEALNEKGDFTVSVKVVGGGINSQAESIRLGIARALITGTPELRKELKAKGFLKRDARVKERRKFGLKKARKSAQWSKR